MPTLHHAQAGSRLTRTVLAAVVLMSVLAWPARGEAALCDGTTPLTGTQMLDVAGARRTFVVRAPAPYDGHVAAPVVFAFHPFGMNAQYMQGRAPITRTWPEAFAVYPEGLGRAGSIAPSWQGQPGELGDRDLAFFDAMLAWLDAHACVDRTRVFVLGYSNGAGLAHLLACERSSAVAAAAIAAGRLSCTPAASKPIVMSHGILDPTIRYDQGLEAARAWAAVNKCSAPPKPGVQGCVAADGCGAATRFCTHPGGHEYDPTFTRTAVDFFKAVPK
jgi:polyhydroxybutyrate depolymerase